MAFRQIGQVWAPVLLVQGDADEHVALGEAHDLAAAARRAGNPDVDVAPIAGADHSFTDRELVTGRAVIGWLSRRA
jgi:alpha-beta hydrolase superfamily lysophospholipase